MKNIIDLELQEIELSLLIEAIKLRYHWDFHHYKKASLRRRVHYFLHQNRINKISSLIPKVLHSPDFFYRLAEQITVPVSEFFRDPEVFKTLRTQVIPMLKTYPYIRIWHAGCASGEEVYSMAILLEEEGLLERSTLLATDINHAALNTARRGIVNAQAVIQGEKTYQQSGGIATLDDYFHTSFEHSIFTKKLSKNIRFFIHNLTCDKHFSQINLILCRNVFIYFDRKLQNKVLRLFANSLCPGGILCLGTKESIRYADLSDQFDIIDEAKSIYRKRYL